MIDNKNNKQKNKKNKTRKNWMIKRKAQVSMLETVLVLIIFFILLGLGIVFYGKASISSAQKKIEEKATLKAIESAQTSAFLIELQCSRTNVRELNCFDMQKIEGFKALSSELKNQYYFDVFGYATINITEIYPGNSSWVIYSNRKGTARERVQVPISLFNSTSKRNSFGVLTVDVG